MDRNIKDKLFSFVIYTSNEHYNTTIDSLISQDIEDNSNIQIILLKNSSFNADNYLSNISTGIEITVADGEFSNVTDAYTSALKYIKGKYVCFTECGSTYSSNVISEVTSVVESSTVKLVSILSDISTGNQNALEINRGFRGKSGMIDLNEKYNIPFMFLSNLFINTELKLEFSKDIKTEELVQSDFMFRIFDQSQTMYLIRRKNTFVSLYTASRYVYNFYEDFRYSLSDQKAFFDNFVYENLNSRQESAGYVPRYVQYNIMKYLCWTIAVPGAEDIFASVMSVHAFKAYLKKVLMYIDDNVINNCGLILAYRYVLFNTKYDGHSRFIEAPFAKKMYYNNTKLCEMSENATTIEFVTLEKNRLVLHGRVKYIGCSKEEFRVFALINQKKKVFARDLGYNYNTNVWKENVYSGTSFEVEIDLTEYDECAIEIFSVNNGDIVKRRGLRFGKFSPLASNVPDCYYYSQGRIMTYNRGSSSIIIERASGFKKFKKEIKYLRTLRRLKNDYASHAYLARILYHFSKPFHRKKIWLISDRTNRGDDNGEAFFKYMQTVKNRKIKCYFVIDKKSDEGKRLSKIGKTISTNSKKHKMYHLMSSYVISSQGNNPVVNPLLGGNIYYRDILCKLRFVFLQHGVTKDDIAGWLNLYNRNIFGFIVTTNPEYKSIFDYDYFYKPENVWLTGMPRNDLLYHDEKKYITIMPTWRKSLMTKPDPVTGIWIIRDDFKESKYFQFYNSLLNDERLISAAKKYGYTICHKPHPNIEPYIDMFDKNDDVMYFSTDKTYREIFAESDLMLTDYSSVAFDFAYLGKPIVYAQFDKQAFFSGEHSYTAGYFDYERDGFGDVTYDLDSTVNCLIEYMKNNCEPKAEYLERIHNTFAFLDRDCCKRVYEKLIENESFSKK